MMDMHHSVPRGMINVPGVAPAPLDTTGLENSFENLGRTMVDVLAMQQQTNLTLQDQIRRANDAQMDQTLAMHDLADITEQRMYDSMFTAFQYIMERMMKILMNGLIN